MSLSAQALEVLTQAGWRPDQRQDTEALAEELRAEEFVPSPAALEFLAAYGGLEVTHPLGNSKNFHFDHRVCFEPIGDCLLNDYGPRLGVDLCPLGECADGYMVLSMAPDGRVFAGYAGELKKVADSGVEAIEVLVAGGSFQPLD